MDRGWRGRKTGALWGLVLLAAAYGGLLRLLPSWTGSAAVVGIVVVILGLYICSHPAANAIDLMFYSRGVLRQVSSGWSGMGWLALNALVVFVGWLVIVIGATRLVG